MRLSKEELEKIEKEFAKDFERNPEKMIAKYREAFGNYLCSDNALELCSAYKDAPKEHRGAIADSIGRTASGITYGTFEQMLKEHPKPDVENIVTFVAGGAGAGKTHFIEKNWATAIVKQSSHIVFEVVGGLKEMNIERVLNAGKDAVMLYIHRPIEAAATEVLKRAQREDGRLPSFDYVCNGHLETQKQMQFLTRTYQQNQSVVAAIGDNSSGKDVKIIEPNTRQILEFLQANAYKNSSEVKNRAFHAVQKHIKERDKAGEPIDKDLAQNYIGKERQERTQQALQLREQREQEQDHNRTR